MPVRVNLAIAHERVKDDVEKPWIRKTPKGKRTTTTNNTSKTPRGSPTQVGVLFFFVSFFINLFRKGLMKKRDIFICSFYCKSLTIENTNENPIIKMRFL